MNSLKVSKIKGFDIIPPKKSAFTIETDPDFPKLHTLTIASGKRGGGKSVAVANLVKKAKDKGYFDRVYLITPTYASNKSIWDIADIDSEDVYEPDVGALKQIIRNIEAEAEEWKAFQNQKEMHTKFNKDFNISRGGGVGLKGVNQIDPDSLIQYYELGFLEVRAMAHEKTKWKYRNEVPPRLAVILDDCFGSEIFTKRTAGLTKFIMSHRHWGDGLGISVFMLVQSYCARDGLDRAIRENCTHLMLFKVNQESQICKIKEEADLPIEEEEFTEMCQYAHSKPFNFLFLDFSAKKPCQQFRSGFDEYLRPPSLMKLCDCKTVKQRPSNNKKM